VNDAVSLALFTITLPIVILPLFTSASNWLAEREQGVDAFPATDTDTLELLFAVFRSVVLADTVAVFHNVELAAEFTSALMLRVATALGKRLPIVHAPVELAYEVLAEAVAFSKVSSEGSTSAATTLWKCCYSSR
jgi:hypothetical protein